MAKKTPAWAQGLSDPQQVSFATAAKKAKLSPTRYARTVEGKELLASLKQPPKQKSGSRRGIPAALSRKKGV